MTKQFLIAEKQGWQNKHKCGRKLIRTTQNMSYTSARIALRRVLRKHSCLRKETIRFVIINKKHPWLSER